MYRLSMLAINLLVWFFFLWFTFQVFTRTDFLGRGSPAIAGALGVHCPFMLTVFYYLLVKPHNYFRLLMIFLNLGALSYGMNRTWITLSHVHFYNEYAILGMMFCSFILLNLWYLIFSKEENFSRLTPFLNFLKKHPFILWIAGVTACICAALWFVWLNY